MGAECCGSRNYEEQNDLKPQVTYSSSLQKAYQELEETYPFLRYIDLHSYIDYLFRFENTRALDSNQNGKKISCLLNGIQEENFKEFIDNKIIQNISLNNNLDDDQKATYKDFLENFHYRIFHAYKNYLAEPVEENPDVILKKIHLIPLGFMLFRTSNKLKMEIVFNLFANKGKIYKTKEFEEFIYILISINSQILLKFLENKINPDQFNSLNNVYSYSNILKLTNLFVKLFFHGEEATGITQIELEKNFASGDSNLLWIFYGDGIRHELESFRN